MAATTMVNKRHIPLTFFADDKPYVTIGADFVRDGQRWVLDETISIRVEPKAGETITIKYIEAGEAEYRMNPQPPDGFVYHEAGSLMAKPGDIWFETRYR